VGHASLMRPDRPLPTRLSVICRLRRNPNIAAAIIAAWVTRWHRASSLSRRNPRVDVERTASNH